MTSVYTTHANTFGPIRRVKQINPHVRLSSRCGTPWLGRNWSPKRDADEIVRIREELELIRRMEELGYGGYWYLR